MVEKILATVWEFSCHEEKKNDNFNYKICLNVCVVRKNINKVKCKQTEI